MAEKVFGNWRRWSLFILIVVAIICQILVSAIGVFTIPAYDLDSTFSSNPIYRMKPHEFEIYREMILLIFIVSGIIFCLVLLFGLIGVYKQHYGLTMTFVILMALTTLGCIYPAIMASINWSSFVFYFFITVLAYFVAKDNKLRSIVEPI